MFNFNIADMKKLLLTGITAALFSVAAIAQEQDSLQNENNQFRENQEQTDPAEQAADSVSTDFREGVNEAEQEMDQAEDTLQQESNELRQDAERAGEKIEESAEEAGEDIEEGAERTGEQMEKNAEEAADEADQQTDKALNNMNDDSESTSADQQSSTTAPELEVVEGKEGPNNEVVYKYQDEYFYIDREKKEVVKAKESELQDAEHKVIVKESEKSGDENASDAEQNNDASNSSDDNSSDNSNQEAQTDKDQK